MSNNQDLAIIHHKNRTWSTRNYFTFWVSLSFCIPSYMLASSLIYGGMNWYQAIITIFLANLIVLVPMLANGHAGAKFGISFPIFARASFGIKGANIPALLRAIVACGWFGIQTWIGGVALFQLLLLWIPAIKNLPLVFPDSLGISTGQAICFMLFWLLHMWIVYHGIELIRKLLVFSAFFLPISAIALLIWAIQAAHGIGPIISTPSKFTNTGEFWKAFFPGLTAMIGFWATIALNIPDFTRFAKSQKAHFMGQATSLPFAMALFAFISVIVTSASTVIYHQTIWDPVILISKFTNPWVVSFAMLAIMLTTLSTNVVANLVSPANDFVHIFPKVITFRLGGLLTGVVGILICPWKLVADPSGYIYTWLMAISSLLGAVGGVMIIDYLIVQRTSINTHSLYHRDGIYSYNNGINHRAVWALIIGILPNLPGFAVVVKILSATALPIWISDLYNYSWFISFTLAGLTYYILSLKLCRKK